MDEINATGGVLGRQFDLVIRDNEHKLDRGVAQTRELIEREGCAAILGSQGSFIGLAVIDTIHELKVPWFALAVGGVGIIENKRTPNYMFRVATNDREVAKFLVNYGLDKAGGKKFGDPQRGHAAGACRPSPTCEAALKEKQPRAGLHRQDEGRRQRLHPADAARQERGRRHHPVVLERGRDGERAQGRQQDRATSRRCSAPGALLTRRSRRSQARWRTA